MSKVMMQFLVAIGMLASWVMILAGSVNAPVFALSVVAAILLYRLAF